MQTSKLKRKNKGNAHMIQHFAEFKRIAILYYSCQNSSWLSPFTKIN